VECPYSSTTSTVNPLLCKKPERSYYQPPNRNNKNTSSSNSDIRTIEGYEERMSNISINFGDKDLRPILEDI
jgi:hypothetical protein